MKIGDTATTSIQEQLASVPTNPARPAPDDAAKVVTGVGNDSSAKVELSSTATALLSPAHSVPAEFDAEKVARIAQAIVDGKFTVNAEVIADKLIANAQELLSNAAKTQ